MISVFSVCVCVSVLYSYYVCVCAWSLVKFIWYEMCSYFMLCVCVCVCVWMEFCGKCSYVWLDAISAIAVWLMMCRLMLYVKKCTYPVLDNALYIDFGLLWLYYGLGSENCREWVYKHDCIVVLLHVALACRFCYLNDVSTIILSAGLDGASCRCRVLWVLDHGSPSLLRINGMWSLVAYQWSII